MQGRSSGVDVDSPGEGDPGNRWAVARLVALAVLEVGRAGSELPPGLDGAEAVLQLRAVRANGDFDAHWSFHLHQERHRVHESRYNSRLIRAAA